MPRRDSYAARLTKPCWKACYMTGTTEPRAGRDCSHNALTRTTCSPYLSPLARRPSQKVSSTPTEEHILRLWQMWSSPDSTITQVDASTYGLYQCTSSLLELYLIHHTDFAQVPCNGLDLSLVHLRRPRHKHLPPQSGLPLDLAFTQGRRRNALQRCTHGQHPSL